MAVYTPLSADQAIAFLRRFDASAQLLLLEEVSAGIENTNYFVTAVLFGSRSEWVLTLFENLAMADLVYFMQVMSWWSQQGFPVPAPLLGSDGQALQLLQEKPAILVPRIRGVHLQQPQAQHCEQIGQLLGRMHRCAPQFPDHRPTQRNLAWMQRQQAALENRLPAATADLLAQEIAHCERQQQLFAACPQGLVHGDLFRDNVLFAVDAASANTTGIAGLIDFNHSGWDCLLFDLAVVANDWCRQPGGSELQAALVAALLFGYRQVRPWTAEEERAWPQQLRLAALRFWIARLVSRYLPGYQSQSTRGNATKDPAELEQLLRGLIRDASRTH